ncbi:SRPBCC family protein [Arcticibacterium luteifluviistationis]|uniref:Polyketide cyclase n=1 Tax=Arcticibacterium luteifluviistationis TaxID=1784714 RepID=A0A2Z4GHI8_9BACT|nr:SRPBCC family protein [Arcticibacterium luteifluviistationis]AWW00642.1 polyketide cyclase [Arcticibacterium luteifluviistationis]
MNKDTILVETTINASLEKVWESWVIPTHIMNWNNASEDWHTPAASNDLKVGGKFSYTMAAKDGSFSFDLGGVYTAIVKKELISYELADGRKVRVEFMKMENGVKIIELFEPESENPSKMQKAGWQAILDSFKKYTEALA